MASEHATGRLGALLGWLAVLAIVLALLGVLASLVTVNNLLVGSSWQVAALLTTAVAVVTLAVVALAGGPPSRWKRTPYW
ncbi:hypothetical protein BRD09_05225 [Halobacteriales archaeon SW_10_68_16]|nr:MAG: hypothetical protein BRD09_05225 [Halobacteriales archaeon SW_10_68_16]